ncbi:MAG: CDP-2,3-bis-(O-geranylgeranyl)-sn-glycerol synthase [Candidatus Micrarchaeota archaeon]|nr:CDP-2,3-bis-(O-geranylgeranyl)-sn-glycerol synthase [Candidatus Micrarchaeota archaeon]
MVYSIVIYPILYILPAYAANGLPVIFGRGKPLDMGRKFRGKRIFGDHKTIRGTISSFVSGIAVGAVISIFLPYLLPVAILSTIGANFGDLFGSFIKRRMNHESGKSVPLLDQYGFFVFAILFALPAGHLPTIYGLLFITVLTGMLHLLTNMGAHRLKLKAVPW